jgi:predicted nucleotidyltransferase component of viral defense system
MNNKIVKYQQDVLKAFSGRIDEFYLAGGTALSLFYFQHRLSVDLDFFTRSFDYQKVKEAVEYLEGVLNKKIDLIGSNLNQKTARMAVYNIRFTARDALKIDFVEDTVGLLKKTKMVDGIRILSLEDIYLRKLYALAGMVKAVDETGREKFLGGRADAKDFYDVYYLSHTFMPLSKFLPKYCDRVMLEAVIRWYRTFDRMPMMDGVFGLITKRAADFKAQEKHFKQEIDKLIEIAIGEV